jgi:O-antigen ligase
MPGNKQEIITEEEKGGEGLSMLKWLVATEDVVIALLFASTLFLYTVQLNSHFTLPKLTVFSVLTVVLLLLFAVRLKTGEYQVLPKPVRFPLLLLIIWWLLATSQAIHPQTALEGQYGRYNGLYTNLLLVIWFVILASTPFELKRLRRILALLVGMLLLVCLYAFVQHLGLDPILGKRVGERPPASIGNPVAFGVVLIVTLPYVFAEILLSRKLQHRLTMAIIGLLLLFALYLTRATGPSAGLVIGSLLGIAAITSIKMGKSAWKLILPLIILLGVVTWFLASNLEVHKQLSIETRLNYFSIALQMIGDSPIFGYGFESYRIAYPLYRLPDDILIFGKFITPTMIHNDYLQYAVDNGVPAMFFYLFFIAGVYWLLINALRKDETHRVVYAAFFIMLTIYLAQAMSGWLEAASSIIYWVLLGVNTSFVVKTLYPLYSTSRWSTYTYSAIVGGGLLVASAYSYAMANKVIQDYTLRKAQLYSKVNYQLADKNLTRLGGSSLGNAYYQDQVGSLYMLRLTRDPSPAVYQLARKYLLRARELNSFDPYIRFHIIETDSLALKSGVIKQPSKEAVEDIKQILQMDPYNPAVYRVRANFFSATGQREAARQNHVKMRQVQQQLRVIKE